MSRRTAILLVSALAATTLCVLAVCVAVGMLGTLGWIVTSGRSPTPAGGIAPTSAPSPAALPLLPDPTGQKPLDGNLTNILRTVPPSRDQIDLAKRLGKSASMHSSPAPMTSSRSVGLVETFWVGDNEKNEHFLVTATLRYVGANSYFYVDNAVTYDAAKLKDAADTFDGRTFPNSLQIFGNHWRPGPDGDAKLTVLNTITPGAGGYYSSADEYPRSVNRYSNQRKMIYIDTKSYPIGSVRYGGVLAHELQHAIHWVADPAEDGWVNEGLSELAMRLNGFAGTRAEVAFARQPGTQLNTWSDQPDGNSQHYGASYAFLSYFLERFDESAVRDLVASQGRGIAGFESVIAKRSPSLSFQDLFADWVVANYLDDPSLAGGRYGHAALDLRATPREAGSQLLGELTGRANQFSAQYVQFTAPAADFDLSFAGSGEVSLIGTEAHGGSHFWWGNRGDSTDTHLTRELDLTGLGKATLSYWLWYDIEKDWDYAYLLVSIDDGATWTSIRGTRTTESDPIGHNYGHGYTGRSSGWVQEEADLSAFVGKRVLVRFEYITDDAVNTPGIAIDDVCLVETKQCDDAETAGSWESNGFVRASAWLPQRYIVQVIRTSRSTSVERLTLDAENRAAVRLPGSTGSSDRVVVVVSPVTPVTTVAAPFTISVSP